MAGIHRHEAMRPLSRHHHHALMAGLKIRKAFEKGNVSEEKLKELQEDTLTFWHNDGNEHFREEEEILIPVYSKYASVDQDEIINMLLEHVHIRALIDNIQKNEQLETSLSELAEALDRHVRREERIIFPMIEKALPEDVLYELQPYFHEQHSAPK